MTTQPATRQGDAPPRYIAARWNRLQAAEAARHVTRQATTPRQKRRAVMAELAAACSLLRAAIARAIRRGDWQAAAYVTALVTQLATDIDRRPS